jgi:hypothetical protein
MLMCIRNNILYQKTSDLQQVMIYSTNKTDHYDITEMFKVC